MTRTAPRVAVAAAIAVAMAAVTHAQWLNFPTPGVPRLPDGTPNLSAPPPRTAEGKPDLTGTWMHEFTPVAELKRIFGSAIDAAVKVDVPGMEVGTVHKYGMNILAGLTPAESVIRPEMVAVMRQRAAERDPGAGCEGVIGFPLAGLLSEPIKIVQSPRTTVVLYEAGSLHRQVFTDNRALPKEFAFPAFLGYSTGRWENDVLVVETAGFNDQTRLDAQGHLHSDALRVTERFRRRDVGHMDVEMTFDDPKMYTKPFTVNVPYNLLADADIFEMFCENEKDRAHIRR